jgi:hypothetical protein
MRRVAELKHSICKALGVAELEPERMHSICGGWLGISTAYARLRLGQLRGA